MVVVVYYIIGGNAGGVRPSGVILRDPYVQYSCRRRPSVRQAESSVRLFEGGSSVLSLPYHLLVRTRPSVKIDQPMRCTWEVCRE